jgi:hypothetical protein
MIPYLIANEKGTRRLWRFCGDLLSAELNAVGVARIRPVAGCLKWALDSARSAWTIRIADWVALKSVFCVNLSE